MHNDCYCFYCQGKNIYIYLSISLHIDSTWIFSGKLHIDVENHELGKVFRQLHVRVHVWDQQCDFGLVFFYVVCILGEN